MKKLLISILVLSSFFISCEKDNVEIKGDGSAEVRSLCIAVADNDGNNLVDPNYEGNILDNEIVLTYHGESFLLKAFDEMRYPLQNKWFWYRNDITFWENCVYNYQYVLNIESWGAKNNNRGDECVIDWGDGTQTVFTIDYYFDEDGVVANCYMDGNLVEREEPHYRWLAVVVK